MKLILSRKGFDTSSGGVPSPIFPDGGMLSLPIPDGQSPITYADIRFEGEPIAPIVAALANGKISASARAHLDPDLVRGSLRRSRGWRPIFGQTGAAQGHLRKQAVGPGDLFLFFGLFRRVVFLDGKYEYRKQSPAKHVLWGWLQVAEILKLSLKTLKTYEWATYHPHFHRGPDPNNTLYIASRHLKLPGISDEQQPGAGVFARFATPLQLTSPTAKGPSTWELPAWFAPQGKRKPLTYHGDPRRWSVHGSKTRLQSVSRGQEFILDCAEYPEAAGWVYDLIRANQ